MATTIRRLRIRQGLEQRDVEKALGLSNGTVSHWELDGTLPKIKYLRKLAKLYNISLEELVEVLEGNNEN